MSEQGQAEHFDLARFVLGYLEHEGSLIGAPAYGVHEVVLPDALAATLRIEPYLELAFDAEAPAGAPLRLSVNHPLVETMAAAVTRRPGFAQLAINHVRLEKRGLFDLASKTWALPNARLTPTRDGQEQAALHQYLRFNFKATFLSDEKQEQIVSVVLDAQAGHAVNDAERLARLVSTETETIYSQMALAPLRWRGADATLTPAMQQRLLERAVTAVEKLLTDRLDTLQSHVQRLLDLDRARLEEYYDSLARDLRQRLARSEEDDAERRSSLNAKLEALNAERQVKLADAQARHRIRLELELINVLLILQPKVLLPVSIANRRATTTRFAVWDPLVHWLEPLVCDACGEAGDEMHLCTHGHLVHRRCLAPQCSECTRTYCQLCADQMLACAVCQRPICRASARVCADCGRITCNEHQKMCHAANGEPLIATPKPPAVETAPALQAATAEGDGPGAPAPSAPKLKPSKGRTTLTPRPVVVAPKTAGGASRRPAAPVHRAIKIVVQVHEDHPLIVAFVLRSTNRTLATRIIDLQERGIQIRCKCEKPQCLKNGYIHRPMPASGIQRQIEGFLQELCEEYFVPTKRVEYFQMIGDRMIQKTSNLVLPPCWLQENKLRAARIEFDLRSYG